MYLYIDSAAQPKHVQAVALKLIQTPFQIILSIYNEPTRQEQIKLPRIMN